MAEIDGQELGDAPSARASVETASGKLRSSVGGGNWGRGLSVVRGAGWEPRFGFSLFHPFGRDGRATFLVPPQTAPWMCWVFVPRGRR